MLDDGDDDSLAIFYHGVSMEEVVSGLRAGAETFAVSETAADGFIEVSGVLFDVVDGVETWCVKAAWDQQAITMVKAALSHDRLPNVEFKWSHVAPEEMRTWEQTGLLVCGTPQP